LAVIESQFRTNEEKRVLVGEEGTEMSQEGEEKAQSGTEET
jgi:hypothetical protein